MITLDHFVPRKDMRWDKVRRLHYWTTLGSKPRGSKADWKSTLVPVIPALRRCWG